MTPVTFARFLTAVSLVYGLVVGIFFQVGGTTKYPMYKFAFAGFIFWALSIIISSLWFYLFFHARLNGIKKKLLKIIGIFAILPSLWLFTSMTASRLGFIDLIFTDVLSSINNPTLSLQVGFINGLVGVRPWLWLKKLSRD